MKRQSRLRFGIEGRWLWRLVLGLTVIILLDQSRYLFTYPVPDTGMWFGDETWTMLTVRAMARTGVACMPEALGSSLAHSNGFINGSIWISGLIYGFPAHVFAGSMSPVEIGRVVTLALSVVLLFILYRLTRQLTDSPIAALFAVFLLVLTNAFYFSTHSARLDLATGLAVLLCYCLFVRAYNASRGSDARQMTRWFFVLPFVVTVSLAVYVHVPTLVLLPALYTLWVCGAFRSVRGWVAMALGSATGLLLLVVPYYLTNSSLSLLGHGYNQYYNVANSLPILHPFSWQVQRINTIDRAIQVWQVAWPIVAAIVIGFIVRVLRRNPVASLGSFFLALSALGVISWMLAEGPAVFYNIHILPVLAVAAAVLLSESLERHSHARSFRWSLAACAIALTSFTIVNQESVGRVGSLLTSENSSAIHALIQPVLSEMHPPLILTDQPGLNEVVGTRGVRLMTNHLLLFGEEDKPLPDILRAKGVDYLLLYSTVKWQSPFRHIGYSLYELVGERIGRLTDQARSYDEPRWNEIDTLRLYKAR